MASTPSRARRWALLAGGALALVLAFVLGPRACRDGPEPPRTIVLLTMDTWRRDHAGFHGPAWPSAPSPTPRLDALAREAVRFADARTPVPLTLPAHVTMLSGLPPAVTGVRTNAYGRLPDAGTRGFSLLAEALASEGWSTGAFVSAEPLAAEHGLAQGFEVYDDASEAGQDAEDALGIRAGADTVSRALAWVRGRSEDAHVFLWVHLFEPHAPYDTLTYAGDVRQGDQVAGALLDGLGAAGRGDAALLVTSDHGEMLDELGERTHGHLLADAVLRVPFLLRAPGLAPTQRDDPVDLSDVAPTLAALAGAPWTRGAGRFEGRDLLAGPVPRERLRVAESLFAHQRFRWAQLVSVTDAQGTLIDVGEGRAGWLAPAPYGKPQGPVTWIREAPAAALLDALEQYKRGEVSARMLPGTSSGGYGGGVVVQPFRPPNVNAALLNPYDEAQMRRLEIADRARGLLKMLLKRPNPPLLVKLTAEIEQEIAADPKNPDLRFLLGLSREARLKEAAASKAPEATQRERAAAAEAAYGDAWTAERWDADTLYRWCAVNAGGRAAACLQRLVEFGRTPGVVWDAKLWTLKAWLHLALGEPKPAEEACAEARKAARTARERRAVEEVCGPR